MGGERDRTREIDRFKRDPFGASMTAPRPAKRQASKELVFLKKVCDPLQLTGHGVERVFCAFFRSQNWRNKREFTES